MCTNVGQTGYNHININNDVPNPNPGHFLILNSNVCLSMDRAGRQKELLQWIGQVDEKNCCNG